MAEIQNEMSELEQISHAVAFLGIQLTRVYDVLITQLASSDKELGMYIENLHKNGETISSLPFFKENVFEDQVEE